jgi:hypothetical protein
MFQSRNDKTEIKNFEKKKSFFDELWEKNHPQEAKKLDEIEKKK